MNSLKLITRLFNNKYRTDFIENLKTITLKVINGFDIDSRIINHVGVA